MPAEEQAKELDTVAEPEIKRGSMTRGRTRLRNSFEHGLAWSHISNSIRDLVDAMKATTVTMPSHFEFPPATTYRRYELWLRDVLADVMRNIRRGDVTDDCK